MKARDLFELRGSPAPAVEPAPPPTKPGTRPSPTPAPPRPKPKFPNPFKPTQPGIQTTPKACPRTEGRATKVVDELLEAKFYAQQTPPYAYQKTCPRCGKAMPSARGPCPNCQRHEQPQFQPAARSVTTPAPPAPGSLMT
jgi:hypothetical protein